jgi:methyl-accepting chemotaxis protein
MRSSGNTRFLNRILRRASIKNQVGFVFGLMLTILIVMPLRTLNVDIQLNQGVNKVTEKTQPVVIKTQNIELELEGTSSSLGYYLLTREDRHKDNDIDHLKRAKKLADQLADSQIVSANSSYSDILELVKKNLIRLESYQDLMIEMPNNDLKNIPAQQIASEQLNSMFQSWQSIISQMLIADYDEDNVDGVSDEYPMIINGLRYYNVQIVSEINQDIIDISEIVDENAGASSQLET